MTALRFLGTGLHKITVHHYNFQHIIFLSLLSELDEEVTTRQQQYNFDNFDRIVVPCGNKDGTQEEAVINLSELRVCGVCQKVKITQRY